MINSRARAMVANISRLLYPDHRSLRLCIILPSLIVVHLHSFHPLRVTGVGVGVHLTLLRSFSLLALRPLVPSHPAIFSIASARRDAAVPMAVRSNSLRAAGVNAPAASALRGVHEGGGIDPFLIEALPLTELEVCIPGTPNNPAFARKLFAALLESLCERRSRDDGAAMWKGVLGGGIEDESSISSDEERTLGVAVRVPHVMSCLTAAGPSWEGVGDGTAGTREKLLISSCCAQ